MYLDGILTGLHPTVAHPQLDHRCLDESCLTMGSHPRTVVQQMATGLYTKFHVDDLSGHMLKLADRLSRLLARPGVVDAPFENALHRSDGARQDTAPFPRHRARE